MCLNQLSISILFHLKKEKKKVDILPSPPAALQNLMLSVCYIFCFQPFENLFFYWFYKTEKDMGHSRTSQRFIKLQPQKSQVATEEVEESSKMNICRLQRPIIKGCKLQAFSTDVQTSNHEFEQKGLSANLRQKLGMELIWKMLQQSLDTQAKQWPCNTQ